MFPTVPSQCPLAQGDGVADVAFTVHTTGEHTGERLPSAQYDGINPAVRAPVDRLLEAGAPPLMGPVPWATLTHSSGWRSNPNLMASRP